MSQTGGWAQLRQQARTLETQVCSRRMRTRYQSVVDTHRPRIFFIHIRNSPQPQIYLPRPARMRSGLNRNWRSCLRRCAFFLRQRNIHIVLTLRQRSNLLGQLSRLLDSEATQSAVKSSNLARHREILAQHRTELSRLRSQISHARDRANLLPSIRNDIDNYRSQNPEAAEAEYMLDEQRRIDNSNNMTDRVLAQAYAVNESFNVQRETLASINRRIVGAASQIPGINSLMSRIGSKKRRDGIILGSFIAFCFLVMLYFL